MLSALCASMGRSGRPTSSRKARRPLAPSESAPALLEKNNRIAEEIGLHGTPTLVWRKADGSVGETDGIPKNWDALIAEVEEAHNVSR